MAEDSSTATPEAGDRTLYGPQGATGRAQPHGKPPPARPATKVTELLPATLGPYEVVQAIGRGGMGMVLRCRDTALKREVAIKVMQPDARADSVARMRFIKEAQITGQLEHPGIVPVHFLGWDEGDHEFFSMKLVSGRPLSEILKRWHSGDNPVRTELPLTRLVSTFERVCETISFAHSRGVIHRDLKPSNVMIGKHGEVWVLDWGLAKLLNEPDGSPAKRRGSDAVPAELGGDVTLDGTICGTPEYMAPEQAFGQALDEGVDIFGLGALLYEMLTGQPPYSGKTLHEVLIKASKARVSPVKRTLRGRNVPRALAAIAHRCLAPRREDRYAAVEDLLRDVRAYAAGESVSALPDTALERSYRFVRQHGRAVAIGTVVAVALLITLSASAVVVARKDQQARAAEAAQQQEREARLEAELEKQKTLATAAETARRRLSAFEPYSQAMDLLMRSQLPERAAALLKESLAIDGSFPEAQFALGEALRACGRPLDAAAAYLKADELSRKIAGRPNLHAVVAAGFALDGAGSYAEAEDAFARAEREGANDPLALVGRAFRLAQHHTLYEARTVAEEALKRAPHLWETHFAVGYILTASIEDGLISPAEWRKPSIAALRKALELSPRQGEVWTWLAVALTRSGDKEARAEALVCAERAMTLEPLNGNRHITRAGYRLSIGDMSGAEQDVNEARRLGIAPANLQVYESRRAAAKGDNEEAFRLMGEVIQKTRDWPSHVANYCVLGLNLKHYDQVKPVVERLAAQHPNYPYLFALRAGLRAAEGNLSLAITEARDGLKLAPFHLPLRKMLAQCLYNTRDYQGALEATEKALELASADTGMKLGRLNCLIKLGRNSDAKRCLETLQKEYPDRAQEFARIYAQLEASAGR